MKFTLFNCDKKESLKNTYYPNKVVITSKEELEEALKFDNVAAKYKDNKRGNENFLASNCIPMDCDNDDSENPDDWVDEKKIEELFQNVCYCYVPSKSNNIPKDKYSKRPRFHMYFPIKRTNDFNFYDGLKHALAEKYDFFDKGAVDVARFINGLNKVEVIWHEGERTIDELLGIQLPTVKDPFEFLPNNRIPQEIKEGHRNTTLSRLAARLLKKYGNTEQCYNRFLSFNEICEPPLGEAEVKRIWKSAESFYTKVIVNSEGYVKPEVYNASISYNDILFDPEDRTDLGEARAFVNEYNGILKYTKNTFYLVYNGIYWEENDIKAQGLIQDFTTLQLKESDMWIKSISKKLEDEGILDLVQSAKKSSELITKLTSNQMNMAIEYFDARAYKSFTLAERDSKRISHTFKESRPLVNTEFKLFDANEFLLNTPSATYDLRTGGKREHRADDLITKCTSIDPSEKGMDLWLECINKIFGNDKELIDYVQRICGLACIGKVYIEALIISYGDGGNGKSTFWNTIAKTLGNYYGKLSADALTTNSKRNVMPEIAELKGKRLIIAAETKEGARLDDSIVKKLCSTDDISGEKKYKDPFYFKPCHTIILYTNHLPKVSGIDDGIWRRLIVIPFNCKMTGSDDIKNYSEYLYDNAGGAVLKWIIEGAKKIISENYIVKSPKVVADAIGIYKEDNDWFNHFINDCCDVDDNLRESSSKLYSNYRNYCLKTGEYARSTTDFYETLRNKGFNIFTFNKIKFVKGLKLSKCIDIVEDFLD